MAKKMGRPVKIIEKDQFEKLCGIQCTLEEIAGWFSVSADTIERWCKRTYRQTFAETSKQKKQGGRISLRRKQLDIALSGNVAMLIWLGKQYLGQSDKLEKYESEEKFKIEDSLDERHLSDSSSEE